MNQKIAYSIALGIAFSALPSFAAENMDEVSALRKQVRLQQQQLKGVNKRLEEIENKKAPEAKSNWSDKIKIKGDLRYRFEQQNKDDSTSKNRQRIRARLGAYAEVNDFTTAGIRIRTGQDANSGNQTIGSNFNGKDIYFDLAYITLAPQDGAYGSLTLGKMKYPWKSTTDLIWDSDVNPEGLAYTFSTQIEETGLFAGAGYFKVQETSSTHDMNLAGAQAGLSQPIGEKAKLTLGGSFFSYENSQDFTDPDSSAAYTENYRIAEGFIEAGIKPFKLYGNYVNNTSAGKKDHGYAFGVKVGDAKKGKWEAKLGYRELQANAAPAFYADSDFAGGGTGIKGARLKAKYNLHKNLQAGFTFIAGEQISSDTDVNTMHLDLIAKF